MGNLLLCVWFINGFGENITFSKKTLCCNELKFMEGAGKRIIQLKELSQFMCWT